MVFARGIDGAGLRPSTACGRVPERSIFSWGEHFLSEHGQGSKPMVPFGIGEFTTHFRTYFCGWIESDVHWGLTDLGFDSWPRWREG